MRKSKPSSRRAPDPPTRIDSAKRRGRKAPAVQTGTAADTLAERAPSPPELVAGRSTVWVPLARIFPAPQQPRLHVDEDRIRRLAENIAAVGILHHPSVRPHPDLDGHYVIEHGNHRVAALRLLASEGRAGDRRGSLLLRPSDASEAEGTGNWMIEVFVQDSTDAQAFRRAVSENAVRQPTSSIEDVLAVRTELRHRAAVGERATVKEVAVLFGLTPSAAGRLVKIATRLSPELLWQVGALREGTDDLTLLDVVRLSGIGVSAWERVVGKRGLEQQVEQLRAEIHRVAIERRPSTPVVPCESDSDTAPVRHDAAPPIPGLRLTVPDDPERLPPARAARFAHRIAPVFGALLLQARDTLTAEERAELLSACEPSLLALRGEHAVNHAGSEAVARTGSSQAVSTSLEELADSLLLDPDEFDGLAWADDCPVQWSGSTRAELLEIAVNDSREIESQMYGVYTYSALDELLEEHGRRNMRDLVAVRQGLEHVDMREVAKRLDEEQTRAIRLTVIEDLVDRRDACLAARRWAARTLRALDTLLHRALTALMHAQALSLQAEDRGELRTFAQEIRDVRQRLRDLPWPVIPSDDEVMTATLPSLVDLFDDIAFVSEEVVESAIDIHCRITGLELPTCLQLADEIEESPVGENDAGEDDAGEDQEGHGGQGEEDQQAVTKTPSP